MTPSDQTELRQRLAAIEHERWSDWQKWMHTKGTYIRPVDKDYLAFPKEYIDHLEDQIATPYDKLTDKEKASDMEQVDRYWPLIEAYVATAEQRARISEQARPITYHLNADATEDYKAGFREAARQADASGELRLAELEQSLRKEQE